MSDPVEQMEREVQELKRAVDDIESRTPQEQHERREAAAVVSRTAR
jgi:hypothetical protein